MIIGNQNLFIGAYAERYAQNVSQCSVSLILQEPRQQEMVQKVEEAMCEVKFLRPERDTVTVSDEARAFLCSEEAYGKMKADTEELLSRWYGSYVEKQAELQKRAPEDPFWGSTGNQWLVFSEHLYDSGYYDDMSDEQVKSIEQLLDKITGGMDTFGRMSYGVGVNINAVPGEIPVGESVHLLTESADLWMDLESSAAALRMFGGQMIQEEGLRREFHELVDQYYEHNAKILVRYRSPSETMRLMREGKDYSYTAFMETVDQRLEEILGQREQEAVEDFQHAGGSGSAYDVTEPQGYVQELRKVFELLWQGLSDWDDTAAAERRMR